jgi:hypothetical protein
MEGFMLEDYYPKLATVDRVRASRLAPLESYRLEPTAKSSGRALYWFAVAIIPKED